ncbi:MAG: glycosyltransferase involved in cell wall biosynthesis, partial [Pirellulaceae bacterium]
LRIAGWLGPQNENYAEQQFAKLRDAGLESAFEYVGSIDRHEKIDFLSKLDVLSVPTTYREPKGLFVLEALAAGVPVVQPNHGAFPELLAAVGGGRMVEPNNPLQLAAAIAALLADDEARFELARAGHREVHQRCNADAMAETALNLYRSFTTKD